MAQAPADLPSILDAAIGVFFHFGFKKTSMDDVAAAAGLSRQGLYLKFRTKEQLFEAALRHHIDRLLDGCRGICADDVLDVEERLMRIFAMLHGDVFEAGARTNAAELLELARSRHGALVADFEHDLVRLVATLLTRTGIARRWAPLHLSAAQLAEHLMMTAAGIKASTTSGDEHKARMAAAVTLVARGEPARVIRRNTTTRPTR
ncbi:MAG: helix-turn-helix transcriptional regulator [Bradyrhizobiaceae bacterium]|nr:helix-turn-helix transcriptional regulator [Bradyrhizobiaceae bacterium]